MELFLKEKIEALRSKMMNEAAEKGSLHHENVLEISRLLDEYIVVYQKVRLESFHRWRSTANYYADKSMAR